MSIFTRFVDAVTSQACPRRIGSTVLALLVLSAGAPTAVASAQGSGPTSVSHQYEKPAPTLWGPCPVNARDEAKDRLVRRFQRGPGVSVTGAVMPGGSSDLTCGDRNYGYYHLANGHGPQWTQKAVKTSENWREVADYAIAESLRNPTRVTYRANNNTYCYSREVYLVNKVRGVPVDVFHPNVVIRAQDGAIITSYPADAPCR